LEKQYPISKKSGSETIYCKSFDLESVDIKSDSDEVVIEGYANNKNKADSYGDIPTSYKGAQVYQLDRMKSNPVMLLDHNNSAASIVGKFVSLKEDEKGLKVTAKFRKISDVHNPLVKDAISSYKNGFAKALSIGGRWYFEDEKNPTHLTKAVVHEISAVAVGSDDQALITEQRKPKGDLPEGSKLDPRDELERLVERFRGSGSDEDLKEIKEHLKKGVKK